MSKPSTKWIKKDNEKILRYKDELLEFPLTEQSKKYIDKMVQYIEAGIRGDKNVKPGFAIASNQVGFDKQVIYVHFTSEDIEYKYLLANPKITSFSSLYSYLEDGEGCLSVDEKHEGNVKRWYNIVVEAIDLLDDNKYVIIKATNLLSIVLQHEIDHLHGILYYDRIDNKNPYYFEEDWVKISR